MRPNQIRRAEIRARFPVCAYCHQAYGRGGRKFTIDHLIPVARGGTNNLQNLVGCCHACNIAKGCRTLQEWLQELAESVRQLEAM